MPFCMEKLEWRDYPVPMVKKFEDMTNRFDRIPACDRQTDRQTSCDGIVRAMRRIVR